MTVQQVVQEFVAHYPNAQSAGSARELALYNRVEAELAARYALRVSQFEFPAMSVGETLFSAVPGANDIVNILSCDWQESAAARPRPLEPYNIRRLDAEYPGWRRRDAARPQAFYVQPGLNGRVLGYWPRPPQDAAGMYPRLIVTAGIRRTCGLGDAIPDAMLDHAALVYGMCRLWAAQTDRQMAEFWERQYLVADQALGSYLTRYIDGDNDRIHIDVPGIRVV